MEASEFMTRVFKQVESYEDWKIRSIVPAPKGEPLESGFSWIERGPVIEDDPEADYGWLYFKMDDGQYLFVSYDNPSVGWPPRR